MATWNGPPNYRSLAGTYTLSAGTTLTIDDGTCDAAAPSKPVNKFDIPIGTLVFIQTKNFYHSFFSTSGWATTSTPSIYTQPYTVSPGTAGPTWVYSPSTTTIGIGGGGTHSPCTPYVVDTTTGTEIEFNSDSSIQESLQELYDAYNTQNNIDSWNSGRGSNGGMGNNGLGMATMGGNSGGKKKKRRSKKNKLSKASQKTLTSKTNNYSFNGLTSGQITISPNLGGNFGNAVTTTTPALPEYQVKGFKSVDDCLTERNPVFVTQDDNLSEDELLKIQKEKGFFPELGKPFHGIVVDKFVPQMFTIKGEKIESYQPTFYKVLINENNCLWVNESVLAPMKPASCPLKDGFEETEEEE